MISSLNLPALEQRRNKAKLITVEETYVNLKQYQVIRSADEARLQNSKHKKSVNRRSENSTNKRADLTRNHPLSL